MLAQYNLVIPEKTTQFLRKDYLCFEEFLWEVVELPLKEFFMLIDLSQLAGIRQDTTTYSINAMRLHVAQLTRVSVDYEKKASSFKEFHIGMYKLLHRTVYPVDNIQQLSISGWIKYSFSWDMYGWIWEDYSEDWETLVEYFLKKEKPIYLLKSEVESNHKTVAKYKLKQKIKI